MLIEDLGEEGLIEILRGLFSTDGEEVLLGIGDDAAVIRAPGASQAWTTDMLLEGIHFQPGWQTPYDLGRKSMQVNLSDLAAMGAVPGYAFLSLAVTPGSEADEVIELCRGINDAAREHGVTVVGGNTAASRSGLVISITLGGALGERVVGRSGAAVGDELFVTGTIGDAAAGLLLLESGASDPYPRLRQAFVAPEARVAAGRAISSAGGTAMTDISDGLATDLRHICQASDVGARVDIAALPLSPELKQACGRYDWSPVELALTGGEDYELLFTAPAERRKMMIAAVADAAGLPATVIGTVTDAASGIVYIDERGRELPLTKKGYEHFSHER